MKRHWIFWIVALAIIFAPSVAGCAEGEVDEAVHAPSDAGPSAVRRDATARDTAAAADAGARELCNGLDDNGNGQVDETFVCRLGQHGDSCRTVCGSTGFRVCVAPGCVWSTDCSVPLETCDNAIDDNCDGRIDCLDDECRGSPACAVRADGGTDAGSASATGVRYEFRVDPTAGWSAGEPYRLRDRWWNPVFCTNTGMFNLESTADGWHRCDVPLPLTPFIGSFFSASHPTWGDSGSIGTVGNTPSACFPTNGVEWRITDRASGRVLYAGPVAGLPCVVVNAQDRHVLP